MPQIIAGKTPCNICGKAIDLKDETVAFPAFVPQGHVFAQFSDGAFHKDCFWAWEDREQFQSLYNDYERVWKSRPNNLSFEEIEEWGKQAFAQVFEKGMNQIKPEKFD